MAVQNIIPVLATTDLAKAVDLWTALLGAKPTFVDGDRWAQFDVAGKRLALAGSDRMSDVDGVMIKVDDLDAAVARLLAMGFEVDPIERGAHERRCLVLVQGASVVLYGPL
ncbi:VOC family protein [Caulobacter hibisci]|uniref:Bleomycin resistance protein n=1 Tax=Caulobacter hibisci TaxID=2035993 RepID=A0ABS0SWS8_9CAUL|nr:VOC family protein [Caulobacter hibisci]MBI1684080.1 bleomycin resistance protein [Caulobacter hibisci]